MFNRQLLLASPFVKARAGFALIVLACFCGGSAVAQQTGADGLTDAARAKRDADRVLNVIKFHAVKQATPAKSPPPAKGSAPAPALSAKAAAAKPAATAPEAAAAAAAVMREKRAADALSATSAAPARAQTPPVPAESTTNQTAAVTQSSASKPVPSHDAEKPTSAPTALPPTSKPTAVAAVAPTPQPAPEEVRLKLVSYVAPAMSMQLMAAAALEPTVVPVRLTVEPNGTVSSARALGDSPRRFAVAAVKAVQQWRFESIPARREVDVDVPFKPS